MMSITVVASLLVAVQAQADPVSLKLVASPKRGGGELRFEGKVPFPDGIALKGILYRADERLIEGRITVEPTEITNDVQTVEGKKIAFAMTVKDPGVYRMVVEYREDLQEPDVLSGFKKSTPGKWTFDFPVWGDDYVAPLGGKLHDFDQQVDLAVSLIKRFAAATTTDQAWKDLYPGLDKELAGYIKKLDQSSLDKFYPAAFGELRLTMRNLKGNAESIEFGQDGTCKGSIDYRTKKPTKTIHSEDFSFDTLLKDLAAAKHAGGREFVLWILKDFRRAGPRSSLSDVLRSEAKRPSVAPYVEGLEGFKDADASEKSVREGK